MFSAICSAALGACHRAKAVCIPVRAFSFSINSRNSAATFSGVASFCSSKRAALVVSKARALKNW
jgi:hypothetical protein